MYTRLDHGVWSNLELRTAIAGKKFSLKVKSWGVRNMGLGHRVRVRVIDVKERFFTLFWSHVLRFLTFFILSTFLFFKNVGKIGV